MAQHTRKNAALQAVTANRLIDGVVVYLSSSGKWSESLADAAFGDEKTAQALLAQSEASAAKQEVVEPYLFEVTADGSTPRPVSQREHIRAKGPTVRLDLGKQAEGK